MHPKRIHTVAIRFTAMLIFGATIILTALTSSGAASTNIKKPKAALVGFVSDEPSIASTGWARTFGELLFAKISDSTPFEWVSRTDSSQSKGTRELSIAGFKDPEITAQLELWKSCDFLLFGRIQFQNESNPTLELEWTRPMRGELAASISIPLKHRSFTSRKDLLDELPKVQTACVKWLKSLNDPKSNVLESPSITLIGIRSFPTLATSGTSSSNPKETAKVFTDKLRTAGSDETKSNLRVQALPSLGVYELDLFNRAYGNESKANSGTIRSTLIFCVVSNTVSSAASGGNAGTAVNLGLFGLTHRGELFKAGWTNLTAETQAARLSEGARALTQWIATGAPNPALPLNIESTGDAAIRTFARSIQLSFSAADRRYDLDTDADRMAWLEALEPMQLARRLDPQNLDLQKSYLRLHFLAPIGKSLVAQAPYQMEFTATWMRLAQDFYPEGAKNGASPSAALSWMTPDESKRLFLVHTELLDWARSESTTNLPPSIRSDLQAQLEARLVALAQRAVVMDPPSYGLSVIQWASTHCRQNDSASKLATLKQSIDARLAKIQAEEAKTRALLPRIQVTQSEPIEFHWENFYRLPPLLPAEAKPRLEKARFPANADLHDVVDMVWKEKYLWMIVHGTEPKGTPKGAPVQARAPEVFGQNGSLESWRLIRYTPDTGAYAFVNGMDSTQISQRMAVARNNVWIAGTKLVEVDPDKLKVLKVFELPPGFSGPVNQMTVGGNELYLGSSRGSAASLDLKQGTWQIYSNLPPHWVTQTSGDTMASVGGVLMMSENEPFRLASNGNKWLRLIFEHTNFPGWSVGTPSAVVRGQSNTIWIASNTGLFHYHPSRGYEDAWITPSGGFGNKSLDDIQTSMEQLRETLGQSYHPANPLTRFPGPIRRLIPDGEFLWVMCQAVDNGGRDWICALIHPASQKWLGHFRIPFLFHGDTAAVALRDKTLWFGGRTRGAVRMLTKVDCSDLYQTPQETWVDIRVSRQEAEAAIENLPPDQKAFYFFVDANYPQVIKALDQRSPLQESIELEWIGALASLAPTVNQPKRALQHVDNILAWEPPGSRWIGLAKTLRVDVESQVEALQFGALPPLPKCPEATAQEFDNALTDTRFVRTLWKRFDSNRDGKLDSVELLSIALEDEPLIARPFVYDWNHNRKLDPEELVIFFGVRKARIEMLFALQDKNQDGLISADESAPLFVPERGKPGEAFAQPNLGLTFNEALQKVDENHDSKISPAEAAYYLTKQGEKYIRTDPKVLFPEMIGGTTSRHDTNGNGKWDQAEIENRMKEMREYWQKQLKLPPTQRAQARR